MKPIISKYFKALEPKAIFFIGFLLSYPIALIATNSIPTRLPIEELFLIGIVVWTVLYLIKPLKSIIAPLLLLVQYLWFFSLAAVLPRFMQDGFETLVPGGLKWAEFIYYKLFGESYAHFILFVRNFLTKKLDFFHDFYYHVFVVAIFAAIMVIVMKLLEKRVNWKVFLAVTGYFVVGWFIYVSNMKGYFSLYFIGLTVYRQYLIYDNLVTKAKGLGERTRYYNYTSAILIGTVLMVFILLSSNLILFFIPVDKINDRIHVYVPTIGSVRNDFRPLGKSQIFSFSSTMYAPNDNILGGPIIERDYTVIMRVKADEGNLYLRGRTKNIYDGSQWLTDFDTYYNNIYSDTLITNEHLDEIIIYPVTIATRTLFSPYKYYNSSFSRDRIYGNEDSIVYRKSATNISSERYSIRYIKPEFAHLYEEFDEGLRDAYLQVPSQGLTETKALVARLTASIEDPYEKMKTMERYLRDNYRYTLRTRAVDTSDDFVESFLFDEKQGYCTYFATSLAVMGRIADVPTRYVEGFITSDFLDYEGFYEVSSNRAHAWIEAYIEGQGWVRFEATPAYLNGDEIEETEVFSDSLESTGGVITELDEDRFFDDEGEDFAVPTTETKVPVTDIILIVLYAGMAVGVVYLIISKTKRLRKDIHDGDSTEKIHKRISYVLSMCRIIDDEIDFAMLPKQVIVKNAGLLELKMDPSILKTIDESLYSKKEFSSEEFETFDQFFKGFENRVKKKITIVGHFMHKFLLNSLYHRDYYL